MTTASRARDVVLDPRTLAVPIFLYGCARAAMLSITHDEALTYLLHVRATWGAVLGHSAPLPSNNHLLNTLAVKALLTWLPPTELVLRLPALIGLALYLWAAQRLVRATVTGYRRSLGLLLLAGNPFTLDLLVISRGYALALGLSLASLAILTVSVSARPWGRSALAAVAAGLAVAANVSFAYTFVALGCVAAVLALLRARVSGSRHQQAVSVLAASVAPFVVAGAALCGIYTPAVVARIQRIVSSWGGERGFWVDTVPSLVDGALYGEPWTGHAHEILVAGMTTIVAIVVVLGVLQALRGPSRPPATDDTARQGLAATAALTLSWIGLASAAHNLAGQRFPVERAASFLLPAITLTFLYLAEIGPPERLRRLARAASWAWATLAVAAVLHFVACVNLSDTYVWRRDGATRDVMRLIVPSVARVAPETVRLGVSWYLEPAVNFYRVTWRMTGLAPVSREKPRAGWDLYYLELADWADAASLRLRGCAAFPSAQTVLGVPSGSPCP
jgi:hypothetical protein